MGWFTSVPISSLQQRDKRLPEPEIATSKHTVLFDKFQWQMHI